jgi:hypothetical protein
VNRSRVSLGRERSARRGSGATRELEPGRSLEGVYFVPRTEPLMQRNGLKWGFSRVPGTPLCGDRAKDRANAHTAVACRNPP